MQSQQSFTVCIFCQHEHVQRVNETLKQNKGVVASMLHFMPVAYIHVGVVHLFEAVSEPVRFHLAPPLCIFHPPPLFSHLPGPALWPCLFGPTLGGHCMSLGAQLWEDDIYQRNTSLRKAREGRALKDARAKSLLGTREHQHRCPAPYFC